MFWRAASATLLLIASGWAQAPGDIPEAAPLRSPFASPIRGIVKPASPTSGNAGEQKPTAAPSKPSADQAAAPSEAQPAKPSPVAVKAVSGRRDPFINPVSTATGAPCLTGGKRCLSIDRIRLKGLVRSESGYIAVVVNAANRAFFLRENDPLLNGYVMRITGSTILFKETGKDLIGHVKTREVTLSMADPLGLSSK
jgi:Tfp pilus assembly protein PilP